VEVLPKVHQIQSSYMGRIITSYLLIGERSILIDSGFAFTPDEVIFPYIRKLGKPLDCISWLVNTHASGDHHGGNFVVKNISSNIHILAHNLDSPLINHHETFIKESRGWVEDYGLTNPSVDINDAEFKTLHGPETPVDISVVGGESLRLGSDWQVVLLHTPGHTPGHLSVYDDKHSAVYLGDAILGSGVPDVKGNLVMPPHYFEVDWYIDSIEKMHALRPKYLLATHYKTIQGDEVEQFLIESIAFVDKCDEVVRHLFETSNKPLDGPDILEVLIKAIGIPGAQNQYNLLVRAHVNKLINEGVIFPTIRDGKTVWQLRD
jgi:glyoxylase-like metal-dependent hydrolase (beta-lactamase superfamily II)